MIIYYEPCAMQERQKFLKNNYFILIMKMLSVPNFTKASYRGIKFENMVES